MKIRAQLVLACFLLSVLPLSAIVIYSYQSSRGALESAYRREADAQTRQMDRRLATIRGDLEQRLAEVSALPMQDGGSDRTPDVGNILMTMGDAASLVDSLEIHPMRVAPMPAVRAIVREAMAHSPHPSRNVPPGVEEPAPPPAPAKVANADGEADPEDNPGADAAPAEAPEPVVIGMPPPPKLPKFTMSAEQRAAINEIAALGVKMGTWQSMSPEERTATQTKLQQLQKDLSASMKAAQSQWTTHFETAQKQREAFFDARRQHRDAARQHVDSRRPDDARRPDDSRGSDSPVRPVTTTTPDGVTIKRELTDADKQKLKEAERHSSLLFGQRFNVPLRKQGT